MDAASRQPSEAETFSGLGRRVGDVWITPYGGVVRPNLGRHQSEADALQELVISLVRALDPEMIWLFGSRARGDARQDSDFDLLVVAKENGNFGSDDYEKVYTAASATGIGADVVPCSLEDFREALEFRTSFVSRIVSEGRLLHGNRNP